MDIREFGMTSEAELKLLMNKDNPFEWAMAVIKNASDYVVDMQNPVSIESIQGANMRCSQCGGFGASMRQTYANKFGTGQTVRDICGNCFNNR